ncbi:MAG: 4'-phosphopantetheinyl transferase superfamily protein [Myxococcales bacterium]|nr:4'-phosphopantetheinyl transferase superfamily protein [Myxococcales bacterium]
MSASAARWLQQRQDQVPSALDWLAELERQRLAGLPFAKRQRDFLLGRWTAKRALAAWLPTAIPELWAAFGPSLSELTVRAADDGAPEAWLGGERLPVTLSLSHSGGHAVAALRRHLPGSAQGSAAVPPRWLGADCERVEPRSELLVADFFTAEEAAQVAACAPPLRDLWITLLWSAKESALKATRQGLREDARRAQVRLPDATSPTARGRWQPLQVELTGAPDALDGWWQVREDLVITIVGLGLTAPPSRLVAKAPDAPDAPEVAEDEAPEASDAP